MLEIEHWKAEILKYISAAAMSDAHVLRSHCLELDKNLHLGPARMAEEATTLNFIRRIATTNRVISNFNAGAILHSRQLESFHSKADLELVIKFSQNVWLNLVLQAKSLQQRGGKWRYEFWDASKNDELINWCDTQSRERGHKVTPGMLLYNEDVPELGRTSHKTPFGACDLTKAYEPPTSYGPECCLWGLPRFPPGLTPAGISLCLDRNMMTTLSKPALGDLVTSHFPLEHLAHFVSDDFDSNLGRKLQVSPLVAEFLSESAPAWARGMLERGEPAVSDFDEEVVETGIATGYVAIDLSQS